jgi:hypothetical protein
VNIHNINSVQQKHAIKEAEKKEKKELKEEIKDSKETKLDTEVVFEKSEEPKKEESKTIEDYAKDAAVKYAADIAAVKEMQKALDKKMENSFLKMAIDALGEQQTGIKAKLEEILKEQADEITPEMINQAKEDVSEDGYFGVEATANRIVDFAKALSGGNPAKAEMLKEAFMTGFEQAEELWGDELPEISKQTKARTEELFDAWIKGDDEMEEAQSLEDQNSTAVDTGLNEK